MHQTKRHELSRIASAAPGVLITTGLLFGLWLGLSDKYDAFHLGAGLASALVVAIHNRRLLAIGLRRTRRGRLVTRYVFSFPWYRLVVLVPWALWQILVANWQVARMILHPRLPIDPRVDRISTGLRSELARAAAATLITLTPGTCVLAIDGDELTVHSIHPVSSASIASGLVEMIRWTFEPRPDELLSGNEGARHV